MSRSPRATACHLPGVACIDGSHILRVGLTCAREWVQWSGRAHSCSLTSAPTDVPAGAQLCPVRTRRSARVSGTPLRPCLCHRPTSWAVEPNKNGGLDACHHKSQTCGAGAGAKRKRSIQVLRDLGERHAPVLKPSPLSAKEKVCLQQDRDKSQFPEFLLQFKVRSFGACRRLLRALSPHAGSWACSQLLCISGSLLGPACGACAVMGHAAARATWSHVLGWQSAWTHRQEHHHGGARERLPPEQRDQVSVQCECGSRARELHCSPGIVLSIYLSIYLPIYPSIHPSIHLSIYHLSSLNLFSGQRC